MDTNNMGNPNEMNSMEGASVQPQKNDWMAIVSLVLGIVSIVACCFSYIGAIVGVVAIVFAILSKTQ